MGLLDLFKGHATIPGMPQAGMYGDPGIGGLQHIEPSDTLKQYGMGNSPLGNDAQLALMAQRIIAAASSPTGLGGQQPIVSRPDILLPKPSIKQQIPLSEGTPQGNVQATTRAGQRRNDFNNLMQSVGNIVKQGVNKKRQNDERDIMHDLAIIQAAASNPDDPHNKNILDKMAQDPKVVKRLQKALGYNPLSGEAPGPETKSLQKFGAQLQMKDQVKQQAQAQAGSAMQNLLSRMPNTQQINPVVSMQAELVKAGLLPKNDMSPKAMLDFVQEAMKDSTKREEIKQRALATNNTNLMRLYDTMIRADAQIKSREIGAEATKYSADKRLQGVKEYTGIRDKTVDNLKKTSDAYSKSIADLDIQISTALKQSGGKDNDAVKRLRDEQQRLKSLKNSIDDTMKKFTEIVPDAKGVDELEQMLTPPTIEDMEKGDFIFNQP